LADKLPWIPWYARDFILDEIVQTELDDAQRWWYMRLIAHQWDHGAVPLDEGAVRGIISPHIHSTHKQWAHFVEVLPKLFSPVDEKYGTNKRLEEVREKHVGAAHARSEKARIAGINSGKARQKPHLKAS